MKAKVLFVVAALAIGSIASLFAQNPMCIIGDASRYGWDKDKSSPLTQDGVNPSKFYYNAWLNAGGFKFLIQNSDWVPSWNKGASETQVLKRKTYADPDVSFSITTSGNYSVVLDTAALTLSVTPMTETNPIAFNTLFMVGNAAPNGWDLGKATELVKNPTNPFEFSYAGPLAVGDFKFPVNRNWGWNQDFFIKGASETQMILVAGGDVKWSITEAVNYKVTLNINTLAIVVEKLTPVGLVPIEKQIPRLRSTVAKNELNVVIDKSFNYTIISHTGSLVAKGILSDSSIDISKLSQGMYILTLNGKTFRFIKQ